MPRRRSDGRRSHRGPSVGDRRGLTVRGPQPTSATGPDLTGTSGADLSGSGPPWPTGGGPPPGRVPRIGHRRHSHPRAATSRMTGLRSTGARRRCRTCLPYGTNRPHRTTRRPGNGRHGGTGRTGGRCSTDRPGKRTSTTRRNSTSRRRGPNRPGKRTSTTRRNSTSRRRGPNRPGKRTSTTRRNSTSRRRGTGRPGAQRRQRRGRGAGRAHPGHLVLQHLDPVARRAAARGDLLLEFAAQHFDLFSDVRPRRHRVVADQQRGADQDDADRREQHREADGVVAAGEQHDECGDRGQADAGPDQHREEAGVLRRLGVPVRHGRRCYRECQSSRKTAGRRAPFVRCPASGTGQLVISRRPVRRPS